MARKKHLRPVDETALILSNGLEKLRLFKEISRKQLGRAINETEQQIDRYEKGAFIPLPVMEALAEALGEPIPKRLIRRISNLRKLENETGEPQPDLPEAYREAFALPLAPLEE